MSISKLILSYERGSENGYKSDKVQNQTDERIQKVALKKEVFANEVDRPLQVKGVEYSPVFYVQTSPSNIFSIHRGTVEAPEVLRAEIKLPGKRNKDDLIAHLEATDGVYLAGDRLYAYRKGLTKTSTVIPTNKRAAGKGGAGSVYESRTYEDIVVKKFNDSELVEAREEMETGVVLNHPNINKSHALIIKTYKDGNPKIKLIMDKAKGRTLLDMRRNGEKINGVHMRKIFDQMKSVFHYLADEDFFWGDLNPGNIFLTEQGDLTVVDFGAWGRHSRFSRSSLLSMQIDETAQTLIHLISACDADELIHSLRMKKAEIEEAPSMGFIKNPKEYLKQKVEEIFSSVY